MEEGVLEGEGEGEGEGVEKREEEGRRKKGEGGGGRGVGREGEGWRIFHLHVVVGGDGSHFEMVRQKAYLLH